MIEPEITCPECGCQWVGATVERGIVVLECNDCSWERIEHYPFHLDAWYVTIRQALAPLDILQSLLTDADITEFLRPRLKGVSHLSQPLPNFRMSEAYLRGEINTANSVYLSQMIVLAVTYSELILKNFFRVLFITQPKRMNPYLAYDGKSKATIDLNELLEANSKGELIEVLAERAADKASAQNIEKWVRQMIKECNLSLGSPLPQDLTKLREQRNVIVHEGKLNGITPEQVVWSFAQVERLLYVIGEAAIKYGILVVDQARFIYETRKRLTSN